MALKQSDNISENNNIFNILETFYANHSGSRSFTATEFSEIWTHYDQDGNGFIDGNELDNFLLEFFESSWYDDVDTSSLSKEQLKELKVEFMKECDENKDSKIDIAELANILPTDEEFLLLFNLYNPLKSSVDFMHVWKKFDKDCSGYIEADELRNFLVSLLKKSKPVNPITEEVIIEYTTIMLQLFDFNKDGKLQFSEMARLLPVKENYLLRPIFKNASKITAKDIERVFSFYDQDRNGTIQDEELSGFLKDMLELVQEEYDKDDMDFFKKVILNEWDVNHDGRISLNELRMLLLQQSAMQKKSRRKPIKFPKMSLKKMNLVSKSSSTL